MAGCENNTPLLGPAHTGCRTTMAHRAAFAYLHEHGRAVRCLHDKVDLPAAASRSPIIAHLQTQALFLQVLQGQVFAVVPQLFGCGRSAHLGFRF